jgi:hypothetical protein
MASANNRYRIVDDDGEILGQESTFDRACALGRELSKAVGRVEVKLNDRTGRVLSAYKDGREVFYTYAGGKEF